MGNQKGETMRWYHYVAYFFGGMFLANALAGGRVAQILDSFFLRLLL
jgi:hypothetical protein